MTPSLCAVIPFYNHPDTIFPVTQRLLSYDLACLIVDDGSDASCQAALDRVGALPHVTVLRLPHNQGKGAAVMHGLRAAHAAGHSHAIQIDADGQHDMADLPTFIATSRMAPEHVVCGDPQYGADAPLARRLGRNLTRLWAWINTMSFDILDPMCGFRLYPLASTLQVIDQSRLGTRMDFDIEILVRMHWYHIPMTWIPTRVRYPEDGVSHFRAFRDNVSISRMHARLFFGMLRRLPHRLRQGQFESPRRSL